MKFEKKFRKDLQAWRWGFDVTISGQRIRRYEWALKRDAREALAALQTRARAYRYGLIMPDPVITLEDLETKLKNDKSIHKDKLARFRDFLEVIDRHTLLKDLTRASWKAYLARLDQRKKKLQPNTINRHLSHISGALRAASEYFSALSEWLPPRAPWLPAAPGRTRLLSKDECAMILAALRAGRQPGEHTKGMQNRHEVYDLFRLMLLTGAREGELLKLTQLQVSWDWRTARIFATKTKTTRVVPLSETAYQILQSRLANAPRFFRTFKPPSMYEAIKNAAAAAKVPYGDQVDGGWVLYDLRHIAATVMENAGIPYSAVSTILGHKRKDQTATYAHAQLDTLRRAVEVLEKHCQEIDGFLSENWTSMDRTGADLRAARG